MPNICAHPQAAAAFNVDCSQRMPLCGDNCGRGVTGRLWNNTAALEARRNDCHAYLDWSGDGVFEPSFEFVIVTETVTAAATSSLAGRAATKALSPRDESVTPTSTESTPTPTSTPTPSVTDAFDKPLPSYAHRCRNVNAYASACSCLGVTAVATPVRKTITWTSTVTTTVTPTPSNSLAARQDVSARGGGLPAYFRWMDKQRLDEEELNRVEEQRKAAEAERIKEALKDVQDVPGLTVEGLEKLGEETEKQSANVHVVVKPEKQKSYYGYQQPKEDGFYRPEEPKEHDGFYEVEEPKEQDGFYRPEETKEQDDFYRPEEPKQQDGFYGVEESEKKPVEEVEEIKVEVKEQIDIQQEVEQPNDAAEEIVTEVVAEVVPEVAPEVAEAKPLDQAPQVNFAELKAQAVAATFTMEALLQSLDRVSEITADLDRLIGEIDEGLATDDEESKGKRDVAERALEERGIELADYLMRNLMARMEAEKVHDTVEQHIKGLVAKRQMARDEVDDLNEKLDEAHEIRRNLEKSIKEYSTVEKTQSALDRVNKRLRDSEAQAEALTGVEVKRSSKAERYYSPKRIKVGKGMWDVWPDDVWEKPERPKIVVPQEVDDADNNLTTEPTKG